MSISLLRAGRVSRPALLLLVVGTAAVASAAIGAFGHPARAARRGPIAVARPALPPVEHVVGTVRHVLAPEAPEQLILDTLPPTGGARLLWLQGRQAQATPNGALVLDGTGGVLLVDERLRVNRRRLDLEGREPESVAPARDGGLWLTDIAGELLHADAHGRVTVRSTAFSFPAVQADPAGQSVWLARSPLRFAYAIEPAGAPLLLGLGGADTAFRPLGTALRPEHILLGDLANAGRVAVGDDGTLYYAPFIRDEIVALTPAGDTLGVAGRGLPQSTTDPRFELVDGRAVIDYHPVNLGLALGPDRRLYLLSTAGFTMTESRLDVFEPVTGRLVRSARLSTSLPTLAVDGDGRVYLLDAFRLLTGVPPAQRDKAPEFDLPRLDAGRVSLSGLRGKVVLLNFWASWCAPCRTEMPALDSLRRSVRDPDFFYLGVNDEKDIDAARGFMDEFGFEFPVVLGHGDMKAAYHYPGLPYTVLLDRDGRVVERWIGFAGPEQMQAIRALIRAELDRGAPGGQPHHVHRP